MTLGKLLMVELFDLYRSVGNSNLLLRGPGQMTEPGKMRPVEQHLKNVNRLMMLALISIPKPGGNIFLTSSHCPQSCIFPGGTAVDLARPLDLGLAPML